MSAQVPSILQAVLTSQAADREYAPGSDIAAAYAVLLHTPPIPENLIAAADLLRPMTAGHLEHCGRIEPGLNLVLWEVLEQLATLGWVFENGDWQFYRRADTPLPSTRATLQPEVAR